MFYIVIMDLSLSDNRKFRFLLSNHELEKENKEETSTVSDFRIIIDKEIDLSDSLLFMRSLNAQVALENFFIDHAPLSLSSKNKIELHLYLQPGLAKYFMYHDSKYIEKRNKSVCHVFLENITTTEPESLITYLEQHINSHLHRFLGMRLAETILDRDMFTDSAVFRPSYTFKTSFGLNEDISLLVMRWLDVALCTRDFIKQEVWEMLGHIPSTSPKRTYTPPLGRERELEILTKFDSILKIPKRRGIELIPITSAQGINLSRPTTGFKSRIRSVLVRYLTSIGYVADTSHPITLEDGKKLEEIKTLAVPGKKKDLEEFYEDNNRLIQYTVLAKTLIAQQRQSKLRRAEMGLRLSFDNASYKCKFALNATSILIGDSQLLIKLDKDISRRLGAYNNQVVHIRMGDSDNITSNIDSESVAIVTSASNVLPLNISSSPKMIHVLCDFIVPPTIDKWPGTKDYYSIHSIPLDLSSYERSNCIIKHDQKIEFHFVKRTCNNMRTLSFRLVDECFTKLLFPKQTCAFFTLLLKPVNL